MQYCKYVSRYLVYSYIYAELFVREKVYFYYIYGRVRKRKNNFAFFEYFPFVFKFSALEVPPSNIKKSRNFKLFSPVPHPIIYSPD